MSTYTVIADVSNAIVTILKKHLIPEVIQNTGGIVLGNPGEKGEASLCVFLYDVREIRQNEMNGTVGMISDGMHRQKYPPMYLELYYAVTAFSSGDIKYRAIEEQKIMGKTMQVFKDFSNLNRDTFKPAEENDLRNIRIEMLRLEQEDKLKILNIPNIPYKVSAFYRVAPVELEATKSKDIQRVHSIDFLVQEGGKK